MAAAGKRKLSRMSRADAGSYWISFSDMLSSLLLVFILAVTFSIYQYYSLLEIKTRELEAQQAELDRTQITLTQREMDLRTAQVTLLGKEEELASIQIQLDQQENDLYAAQTALKTKEEEQALLQLKLSEQATALASQQKQLDDLLGVRTAIIQDLSRALSQAEVGAKVDATTGDIILDSQLMFESGRDLISPSGQVQLQRIIPVYLSVLMRPEYRDFLAEIIIEGHTDSVGSYMFNLELSQTRALEVAKFALEIPSLSAEQRTLLTRILTAKGRSFSNPILHPDGTENRDASRRVEIKFRLKDTEMIQRMNEILSNGTQP